MKKFLIAATAAAMLMTTGTPAKAGSDWVGPAILGTIFGVIIANGGHGETVHVERRHRRHGHYRGHRHHRRHARSRWVEVCKPWPHTRRNHHGGYRVIHRYECRWLKKAIW